MARTLDTSGLKAHRGLLRKLQRLTSRLEANAGLRAELIAERNRLLWQARQAGVTQRVLAETIGVTRETAWRLAQRGKPASSAHAAQTSPRRKRPRAA